MKTANCRFGLLTLLLFLTAVLMLAACGSADDDDEDVDEPVLGDDDDDDTAGDDDTGDDDDTLPEGPTQYPIILVHGFAGWGYLDRFAYFYQVTDFLTEQGYQVLEPAVTPVATIEQRAEELRAAIEEVYPTGKINIIAHSQGGLDARYLISHLGWSNRVASLTTVSCPHHGSGLVDLVAGLLPDFTEEIIDWIIELLGLDWDVIKELTRENITENFNPNTPDQPEVSYFSYWGNGEGHLWSLMVPTHTILKGIEGCNDGIIGCESSKWGTLLGELPTDHAGEIGHPLGRVDWDWLNFYLSHCEFLAGQGF